VTTPLTKAQIAARIAADIPPGSYVNLGIGIPTLVANAVDPASEVVLQSENGILGSAGHAKPGTEDYDFVDAGKAFIDLLPGASLFDSSDSFGMMRSGALDIAVLGAFQVSAAGDLANWRTLDPELAPSVGGAMDLAVGAKQVFVAMTLFDREGRCKLVPDCTFPLTAPGCVTRLYTDYGVFAMEEDGVAVVDLFGGATRADIEEWTGITLLG
jgi:3-oxoadipate CoA-transferase beta subunit